MCCFGLLGRSLAYALVDLVRASTIEIQLHKLGTCMVVWRIAEYNLWTRRDVSIGLFRSRQPAINHKVCVYVCTQNVLADVLLSEPLNCFHLTEVVRAVAELR